jgi:hypothetical protein
MKEADWLPLVIATLPPVSGHPNSRLRSPASASTKRDSPCADEALEPIALVEDVAHALAEPHLHLRDVSRISTAEHEHALVDGQRVSEIVHELDDSGIAAEAVSEAGEFHCRTSPHIECDVGSL